MLIQEHMDMFEHSKMLKQHNNNKKTAGVSRWILQFALLLQNKLKR